MGTSTSSLKLFKIFIYLTLSFIAEAFDHSLFLYCKRNRSLTLRRYIIHLQCKNHQIINWQRYTIHQSQIYRVCCQNRQQKEYLSPQKVIPILLTLVLTDKDINHHPSKAVKIQKPLSEVSPIYRRNHLVSSRKSQTSFLEHIAIDWLTIRPQSWKFATFDTLNIRLKDWSCGNVKLFREWEPNG